MEILKYHILLLSAGVGCGGVVLSCENKCQRKLVPAVVSRMRRELHQDFIQSVVSNELQSPEMGKIPFLSGHTVLSSINIHLTAVTMADLIVTLGKSLSSCMGFFH